VTGLKTKRLVWTIIFLGITGAAIVMECVAGLWGPAGTIPWTEYLARYVPWPFQLVAYVALAVWLPFHFWRHDHLRKVAYEQGYKEGHVDGARAGLADMPPGVRDWLRSRLPDGR
jgi:putative Ca2+/H+ antiporter (TMEM165/GDT1 family)